MPSDGLDRDDVQHALDALASEVPAPTADAASLIARGRRRILRQRLAVVGVALAVIATAASVGAVANNHDTRRVVAPTTSTIPSAVGKAPSGIAVVSADEAWKCLDPLQHTVDGGRTWTTVALPDPGLHPENCTASAGGNLWADSINFDAGTASVIRVRDGTDAEVLPFPHFADGLRLSSLTFVDADHGWVETYREVAPTLDVKLYRTLDGGTSWKLVSTDPDIGQLAFVDAEHGWTMTGNHLFATSDGGVTWRFVELPEPSAPGERIDTFRIAAHDDWIVVWRGVLISGSRYHPFFDFSTDGGRTWSERAGPEEFELPGVGNNAFAAIDGRSWVLTSGRSLRIAINAGEWETRPDVPKINVVMFISFPTAEVGWATSDGGTIFRTADGARTWTNVTDGAASSGVTTTTTTPTAAAAMPAQLAFPAGVEGWICGDRVSYSTSGFDPYRGETKDVIIPPNPAAMSGDYPQEPLCAAAPGGNFWLVRDSAKESRSEIVHVTIGSTGDKTSVSPFNTDPFGRIEALDFVDAMHGWAIVAYKNVPNLRTLYVTGDGGVNWSLLHQDAPIRTSLAFADTTHGWSVSNNDAATLAATSDGGRTWRRVNVPTKATPGLLTRLDVSFAQGSTVIAQGAAPMGNFVDTFFDVSTDGGRTWDLPSGPQSAALSGTGPSSFSAADADHWALGVQNRLYVTNDGGKTWTDQEQFAGIDEINYVARPSANVMFVSGYGDAAQMSAVVLGTINGGENWTTVDFSAPPMVGSGGPINWPGGIVGCPTRTITPAGAGDPPPGLVDAAFAYIRAQGLWEPDTASAVYKVGDLHTGVFGDLFSFQLRSCPRDSVANAWVVELNGKPGQGGGGSTAQAQVVLAHYADGWHVFGRYH